MTSSARTADTGAVGRLAASRYSAWATLIAAVLKAAWWLPSRLGVFSAHHFILVLHMDLRVLGEPGGLRIRSLVPLMVAWMVAAHFDVLCVRSGRR